MIKLVLKSSQKYMMTLLAQLYYLRDQTTMQLLRLTFMIMRS